MKKILLILVCLFKSFLYADISVSALGGKLSFNIVGSTGTGIFINKGEKVVIGTMVITNDGDEPFDTSIFLTPAVPWKLVESFDISPSTDHIRFFGMFSNNFPIEEDFDSHDILFSTPNVAFIDNFAKNNEDKKYKGYDISPGSARNFFLRIDTPTQIKGVQPNQQYHFTINLTVTPSMNAGSEIGISGGKIELVNRISLEIPQGALKETVSVKILKKDNNALPGTPFCGYEILPEGVLFRRPCDLSIYYADDSVPADKEDSLKIFYWDDVEWRYTGGEVDKKNKVVKTKIVHLSIYALFAFTGVPEYRPKERIITPSYQDGKNDIANFDILVGKDVEIKIYDITGRKVRTVNVLTEGNIWNGKDGFGNLVESGVYLYQFKLDEKLYSGTIAVAK